MKNTAKEKKIKEAGQRAFNEALKRKKNMLDSVPKKELGGREGPEPTRYGDWEKKGITSDF